MKLGNANQRSSSQFGLAPISVGQRFKVLTASFGCWAIRDQKIRGWHLVASRLGSYATYPEGAQLGCAPNMEFIRVNSCPFVVHTNPVSCYFVSAYASIPTQLHTRLRSP